MGDGATHCKESPKTRPASAHKPIRLTLDDETAQSLNVGAIFVRDRETLVLTERLSGRNMQISFAMSVPSRSSVPRAQRKRAGDPRASPREKLHDIDHLRSENREERDGAPNRS